MIIYFTAQTSADPCSVIRGGGAALPASAVFNCYRTFTISNDAKTSQINTLLAMTEVYPYTNIAKSKVDIVAELSKIRSDSSITLDFDFHSQVSNAITKLEDGHFAYSAQCYSVIQFFQPWVIAAKYTAGNPKPTLYLRELITSGSTISIDLVSLFPTQARTFASAVVDSWTAAFNDQDPSLFVGYTIDAIDGQDPITAVQAFADKYTGASHTPETRFNYALANTQYSKDFSRTFCGVGSSSVVRRDGESGNDTLSATPKNPFRGNPNSAIEYMSYLNGYKEDESVMATLRSAKNDEFDAFYMLNSKTGVFTMPGFIPLSSDGELTVATITSWFQTMARGLRALENAGANNLIIDFTSNGGGIICAGKALLSFLFKDNKFVQYDVRLTDTNNYLLTNANNYRNTSSPNPFIMSGNVIPDGSSTTSGAGPAILSNSKSYTRGGVTEKFSGRFDIDCADIQTLFNALVPFLPAGTPATLPLSPTASAARHALNPSVPSGLNITSKPTCGSVLDYETILDAMSKIPRFSTSQPSTTLPAGFPIRVKGQVLFWESYSSKTSDTPDEWIDQPADEWVAMSDSTEIVEVWNAVAAKMPTSKLPTSKNGRGEGGRDGWVEFWLGF
ncbi:hypothetical protein BC829DRAFT_413262 [Chytridium lagenaria]|nr:hypothetical protein BC829DRAFT_413262 [Chytridium lagenaria]